MKISTTRFDPRAVRTRLRLQQAMGELLTTQSFASVTVQEITRRAEVNRATFYAHFQDKDDLLESTLREKCRRVLEAARPAPSASTPAAWQHLIQSVLEFFARMPCVCPQAARQWNGIVTTAMREELDCLLHEWLTAARPGEAVSPVVLAAVSGAIVTSGLRWLRGTARETPEEGADALTAFLLRGLGFPTSPC